MPVAPILGGAAALGSLGLAAGSTAYGISEQEAAKQRSQQNYEQQSKRAQEAAKITGNILSQDYIDKTLAPALGYGAKQTPLAEVPGVKERSVNVPSAYTQLANQNQTPRIPLDASITPGAVKNLKGK